MVFYLNRLRLDFQYIFKRTWDTICVVSSRIVRFAWTLVISFFCGDAGVVKRDRLRCSEALADDRKTPVSLVLTQVRILLSAYSSNTTFKTNLQSFSSHAKNDIDNRLLIRHRTALRSGTKKARLQSLCNCTKEKRCADAF